MQTLLHFDDLQIAVQAQMVQSIPGGYHLQGQQISLLHPFGKTNFYRHGFHSWSLSAWLPLGKRLPTPVQREIWPQIDHPHLLRDYPFTSSGLAALQGPDGNVLLLGALELDASVKADSQILRGEYTAPVAAGARCSWYLGYAPEEAVFTEYTRLLAERYGERGQGKPPRVWCSWYSFFTDIHEDRLLHVLDGLAGLPFDVFQLDDGWQIGMGDWEANPKFPSGMAALADKIRQHGLTPGLWLAPLIVQPKSSLYHQHPDWLLRDAQGQPVRAGHNWGDDFFGLDTTHPAVQEWMAALIGKVRNWGFEYLKLDFLYAAALPGVRYQNVPGEQAYRQGLQVIRQVAGEAYFLACGAPVIATLGLADGLRVGPDVAPFWDNVERSQQLYDLTGPSTLNGIRTSLQRLWLRPVLQVDPDVAFMRSRFNLLSPAQKQLLQDLVQITGFRAISDPPDWLDQQELDQLRAFLAESPQVEKLGRYLFRIDDRQVDFSFLEDSWPA
ncbi:MAG: glycoside hydrolase family 36 protein [Chloroflexota bacterium]